MWRFVDNITEDQEKALDLLYTCTVEAVSGCSVCTLEEEREILLEASLAVIEAFRQRLSLPVIFVGGEACAED